MKPPYCRVCNRDHWGVCWTPTEAKLKSAAKIKKKSSGGKTRRKA